MLKETVCGKPVGMGYSRQDREPGRAFGGIYLWPSRWGAFGFGLGCFITLFLIGAGLAGLALGHPYAGGAALFFGVVYLLACARDFSHRRLGQRRQEI
jgi:hypothetical protein